MWSVNIFGNILKNASEQHNNIYYKSRVILRNYTYYIFKESDKIQIIDPMGKNRLLYIQTIRMRLLKVYDGHVYRVQSILAEYLSLFCLIVRTFPML